MASAEGSQVPQASVRPKPSIWRRLERHFQKRTVGGLMELFPLLVTVLVIGAIIGYADGFIHPVIHFSDRFVDWEVPWLETAAFTGVGLIVLGILFYLTGLVIAARPVRAVFNVANLIMSKTPLVGSVYGLTQTIAGVMSTQNQFTRVVFIEWPRENMLAMGFVTGRAIREEDDGTLNEDDTLALVYIPTVPNPTSGNMALVKDDDLIETSLTVEEAMRMIFSGGIVLPPTWNTLYFGNADKGDFIGQYKIFQQ